MTEQELRSRIDALENQLIDARVDLNISEEKRRQLEKDLADANRRVRELERDTVTVQTLSLDDEDADFDPRNTGEFRAWKGVVR